MRPACRLCFSVLLLWLCAGFTLPYPAVAAPPAEELYQQQIRTVLRERCLACHGALRQEAGLRLDTAELIRRGGDSGVAVVPGDPDASLLISRITSTELSQRMPPEGEALKSEQIAALREWVQSGAAGPAGEQPEEDPRDHWAFRSPVRPSVPDVKDVSRVTSPLDAFLQAVREQHGLTPQSPAEPRTWLRRVSLDLTGLPPTLEEQQEFLADHSPAARAQVVDRLLASVHYGERWGRHWMDIWRYSDWWGLGAEVRNSQKHIWHWRDWIIESLNADTGYDQMLLDMLAADELHPTDSSRLRATGFLARQYFKFNRTSWLDETLQHTFKSMLGMTFNCAKCHDHKYDPLSQQEYYQLRAFFEPYQIRTDLLPGITDADRNGIPRAFDCNAEAPTWLHIRGDDRNPDKERPIVPRLPAFLNFDAFPIQPIQLPAEACRPQLRPEFLAALQQAAESRITQAQDEVRLATGAVREATERESTASKVPVPSPPPAADAELLAEDSFTTRNAERWTPLSGDWKWENGHLRQQQTGAADCVLERRQPSLPMDFETQLRFTTVDGQMWKSVGLRFDVTGGDNVMVYLSSYAGGSKVQLAWKQNGQQVYPEAAMQARPVPLNAPQELTVRVRGRLINVLVNGELAIVSELPFERRTGTLQLIAFDAVADFHSFRLKTLPAAVPMRGAADGTAPAGPPTLAQAQATLQAAEARLAAAAAEPELLRAKAAAERAMLDQSAAADTAALVTAAAQLERRFTALTARETLARAESQLLAAPPGKRDEAEKQKAAAAMAVEKAEAALAQPATTFTPLVGSLKTLESNLESEESRRRPFPTTSTGRRSALARWIASPRNPLTARVAVNHIWARHFGRPLVASVFDFGRRGARPTHPELLDWLAVEFMENGWSLKHLHRLILLSDTWGLSSSPVQQESALAKSGSDPENRWYWRGNSVRMEAQIVRDSLLFLAGRLDPTSGGPSIPVSMENSQRRSLYFVHSHNEHQKFLALFDDANVLECYRRADSIVPQQALALENSPLALEMSARIADALAARSPAAGDEAFVKLAYAAVLAAEPAEDELSACVEALSAFRAAAAAGKDAAAESRAALVQVLINQHDFITIR
ncbi:MAG: PSD1 and planctomycete cytochrome C domain-containing protein [Planctomycetota bacterium]